MKMSNYLEIRALLGQLIAVQRHGGTGVPARLADACESALLNEAVAAGWVAKTADVYSITEAGRVEFRSL